MGYFTYDPSATLRNYYADIDKAYSIFNCRARRLRLGGDMSHGCGERENRTVPALVGSSISIISPANLNDSGRAFRKDLFFFPLAELSIPDAAPRGCLRLNVLGNTRSQWGRESADAAPPPLHAISEIEMTSGIV
jgi:hypothetical protein